MLPAKDCGMYIPATAKDKTGERDLKKITGKDIKAALHTSSPIIVTFLVLGIGYGILMQKHGYGPVWSLLSGIIIFSGTAQFVSVTMLSSGSVLMAGLPEIISLAAVTGTYLWKRNTILSVVIGTVLYMFLVQSIF